MRYDPLNPNPAPDPKPQPQPTPEKQPTPTPPPVAPASKPTAPSRRARASANRARTKIARRKAKTKADPQASLTRAVSFDTTINYGTIIEGFTAMGIPASDIKPRENVFTFNAWRALGRVVKRGEHGIRIISRIPGEPLTPPAEDGDTTAGDNPRKSRPKFVGSHVFHISQTKPIDEPDPAAPPARTESRLQPATPPQPQPQPPAPTVETPAPAPKSPPAWWLKMKAKQQQPPTT